MKFIIPQNYKFKNKILEIIDYPTAIFNIIWNVIVYFLLKNFQINITIKFFIYSTLSFPVLLLTVIGFNNESPIYSLKYIFRFLIRQKVYLFK